MKKFIAILTAVMLLMTAASAMAAGSLVVYSPHDADPLNAGVAMFQAAYPDIDVQVIAAGTGELCQRIVAESENPQGDVLWGGGADTLAGYVDYFEPYVCANDAVAIRLMQTLSFLGKRVPEDIAVVGCDGIDSSRLSVPSLTTIHQPVEQIAEQAFMTLMSRIRNTTGGNPREILLDAPLVARSSTIGSNSCARKIRIRKGIITS